VHPSCQTLGVMKAPVSPVRLVVEATIVACSGALASAILYSEFWQTCCRALSAWVFALLIPSFAMAVVLGGGVHSATKYHYYVAVVLQFLAVWVLVRWWMARRLERRPTIKRSGGGPM
jgi:hypothetical protein